MKPARAPETSTGSSEASIRVSRPFHAWLHYQVLSHVDLTPDARSLYDRRRGWRPWVDPLRRAMMRSPEDGLAQVLPLLAPDYGTLYQTAGDEPLGVSLRDAWTFELSRVVAEWQADQGYGLRLERFWSDVAAPLARCRAALWGDPAPSLTLFDVPALGRHGRGRLVGGQRLVAVDLGQPREHVFCRLVYEEARACAEAGVGVKDSSPEAAEAAALGRAGASIEAEAPQMAPAFHRWRGVYARQTARAACE